MREDLCRRDATKDGKRFGERKTDREKDRQNKTHAQHTNAPENLWPSDIRENILIYRLIGPCLSQHLKQLYMNTAHQRARCGLADRVPNERWSERVINKC